MARPVSVNEQLRVLVLADSRAFHTERYVRELRKQGCRVLPASLERGTLRHLHLPRFGPFRAIQYPLAANAVRTIVRRFRPHVVNAHHASGYGFLAALAAQPDFPPIALHLYGSDILIVPHLSPLHRWKVRRALESAGLVIGDSQFLVSEANRLTPLRTSTVIPWGLERAALATLVPVDLRTSPLRIITPRPHEPVYDNMVVLEALSDLLRAGSVSLTVPASGSGYEMFRARAEQLGVTVTYYPRSRRREFVTLMSQHHIYLSASRSDSSPVSLLEAMGLGLIPVVADIPGVREWATSESSLLFSLGNLESLRSCVERLLTSSSKDWNQLRIRNVERIRQEAVYEDNIAATIEAMRTLVGAGRR